MTVSSMLPDMTLAELHCVMTSGFATVTGSLFGLYVSLGVPPSYLIAASVMSAPAALAVAKLFWPETDVSVISNGDQLEFKPPCVTVYCLDIRPETTSLYVVSTAKLFVLENGRYGPSISA